MIPNPHAHENRKRGKKDRDAKENKNVAQYHRKLQQSIEQYCSLHECSSCAVDTSDG
jgi:thiamine monophosphate kinase